MQLNAYTSPDRRLRGFGRTTETMMTTDRRALTIVIGFLGLVMLGVWIAHAWAVATQENSRADGPSTQFESTQR